MRDKTRQVQCDNTPPEFEEISSEVERMQKGAAPLQQTATVPKIGSDGWTDGSEGLPDRPRAFMEDSIQIALAGFLKVGEGNKHDDDASKTSSKQDIITVVLPSSTYTKPKPASTTASQSQILLKS